MRVPIPAVLAASLLAGCAAPGPGGPGPHGPPPDREFVAGPGRFAAEPRPPMREAAERHEELAGHLHRFVERTERLEVNQKELAGAVHRFMERVERLEAGRGEGRRPAPEGVPGPEDLRELRVRAAAVEELRAALGRKEEEVRRLRNAVERLERVIRERRERDEGEGDGDGERESPPGRERGR